MKKDNLEDLFKDSFENFEAEVSPSVWKNVQTALKGVGIGLLGKTILNKVGTSTVVAVVSSAAAIISTVLVMNWGGKTENKTVASNNKPAEPKVIIAPKPAKKEEIKEFLSTSPETPAADNKANNTKADVKAEEKEKAKEPAPAAVAIKKDMMKQVINEYSNLPVAAISASPIAGTIPLVVNVSNSGTGKINKWSFGDGQKETGTNPLHVYAVPGVYTIALSSTNADGKTSVDSVKVEVYGNSSLPPTAKEFTPNGDGNQDVFGFNSKYVVSMNVIVFDKNNVIYYKSDNIDAKWDGRDLKGQKAKEGIYFFIQTAVGTDGKKYEQNGAISLIR